MKVLAIIPARYESSRFPGKPLADIGGKSMIQCVYEQAMKASSVDKAVVATDDKRIFNHLNTLNYEVAMTSSTHQSGTDRCAEIATQYTDYEYIVNIQGDEPFIHPKQIDDVVESLKKANTSIGTLAKKIENSTSLFDTNVVKVVRASNGDALYFSRSPIPFFRGEDQKKWIIKHNYLKHIGIYAFRRTTLLELTKLAVSSLEQSESLEQLRWLEAGYKITVALTNLESIGIDTPEDLREALKKIEL